MDTTTTQVSLAGVEEGTQVGIITEYNPIKLHPVEEVRQLLTITLLKVQSSWFDVQGRATTEKGTVSKRTTTHIVPVDDALLIQVERQELLLELTGSHKPFYVTTGLIFDATIEELRAIRRNFPPVSEQPG